MARLGTRYTYQTFWGSTVPPNTATSTVTLTNFGIVYQFLVAGRLVGMRYARENRSSGFVMGQVFSGTTGALERVTLFRQKTATAAGFDRWEHAYFHPWLPIAANAPKQIAIWCASMRMKLTTGGLNAASVTHGNIRALIDNTAGGAPNGATTLDGCIACSTSSGGALYGIDVLFLPT